MSGASDTLTSVRFVMTGIVQGVGFRPFVHRLGIETGLRGIVGNDSTGVFIEVTGHPDTIDEFEHRLRTEAPPLASIVSIRRTAPLATRPHDGFSIVDSQEAPGARASIPPDTAACEDCRRELRDPADRRFGHPFISCTNCGPRFTVITGLPYDRPATTMADFALCDACRAEYDDPTDRRHHAQTIACHDCGPRLRFRAIDGLYAEADTDPIQAAVVALRGGATVAIKGVGGHQLACAATSDAAVSSLRQRKARPDKPFAIMVADLAAARRLAVIDDAEAAQLVSPARPAVLVRARADAPVSPLVAPANPMLGIMLPASPLHELLLDAFGDTLVMTSGNLSGEPIAYVDADAEVRLAPLCDAVLAHDRPIQLPVDDSVVRVVDGKLLPIRRARGFAPIPVPIGAGRRSVLATGGELKNTFCLASTDRAWVSQHIGDMENLETLAAFESTLAQFGEMYEVTPEVVAVDAHPGYATARWARTTFPGRIVEVQHHHAHVAAVMAEHECDPHEPVIGVAFDGTGYGRDGTIWGGEVLVATVDGFDRVAHLAPIDLPGGDAAVRHPCRVALAYLHTAGIEWAAGLPPVAHLSDIERGLLARQLERRVACVPATSMGRLFDAVASLIGLRHEISFEAQAAIDLEIAAADARHRTVEYHFDIGTSDAGPADADSASVDPASVIDHRPVLAGIVADLRAGVEISEIAWGFHRAVADVVAEVVAAVVDSTRTAVGDRPVVLSGGVFQNALLTGLCLDRLSSQGQTVLTHHLVPPNDGGLALGQAFIAAHQISPHRSTKES